MRVFLEWLTGQIVRLILKLPDSWKIALSGGRPVVVGGRTLDPNLQLMAHLARKQTPIHQLSPEQARAVTNRAERIMAARPEPGVTWSDFSIPSRRNYDIPVRLYRPQQQDPDAPMMGYWHMGGGVIGGLETCHAFCSLLSRIVKCPILSVDYRLAPEHRFPAGLEDCLDAYEWILKNAKYYGAPAGRATVGGSSMGGNFSAIIAQETRRLEIPMPDLQLLIYPATDIESDFPSANTYGDAYPLDRTTMEWFMSLYLPETVDRTDVLIQPGLDPRLEGLPPAIIATAGFDPLLDDGATYAKKLKGEGVNVTYKCYDSLAHGFTAFMAVTGAARDACTEIAEMTRTAYLKL